jgi:hypothetical protein
MINLNSAPPDRSSNRPPDPALDLLDAASLETVLRMLEVIDSVADLALLETLTPSQKRQVWDATPPATRLRLKQLRSDGAVNQPLGQAMGQAGQVTSQATGQATGGLSPSVHRSYTTPLIEAVDLLTPAPSSRSLAALASEDESSEDESSETNQEETAAIDLESQREEIDLMLREPLDLMAQPTVQIGDWVVLHAQPKLSKAEMLAIWEVIEVQGNYARIGTRGLGSRLYPMSGLAIYPKPVVLLEAGSHRPAPEALPQVQGAVQDEDQDEEPEF